MRIYVAARFEDYVDGRKVARLLRSMGHVVTSTWLDRAGDKSKWEPNQQAAQEDIRDINDADMLVVLSHTRAAGYTTGGSHVEFGYALAMGKRVAVLGPKESVFHDLPGVLHFRNPGELTHWLTEQTGEA